MVPPDSTRLLTLSGTLSAFISSTALYVRVRFCRSKSWQIAFEICDEFIGCAPSTRLERRSVIKVSSLASRYVWSSASRYGRHATRRKKSPQRCVSGQQVQHLKIHLTIDEKYYSSVTNCVIKARLNGDNSQDAMSGLYSSAKISRSRFSAKFRFWPGPARRDRLVSTESCLFNNCCRLSQLGEIYLYTVKIRF
jgi:hypothetical protein